MKKSVFRRLISIAVIAIMLISLVPNVFAAYEDGQDCPGCGHYHWDGYMCGVCGYCSGECTDTSCFVAAHCNECGKCLTETVWCSDCMTCEECYVYNGWHCLGCNDCYFTDEEGLCGECWFCESCVGAFCDDCGFCLGCQELDGGVHCAECGNCYAPIGPCESGGDHCKECCLICEVCETCVFDEGLELCDECNLCELCCAENALAQGCDCDEYCVEQSEWFEHICPDCGVPYCSVEQCELCGLCLDCCEGNSDCSDGMCVMDDEYDEHFCADCGDCAHNIDLCGSCYDAGELRCEDCCDVLAQDEGCDCGDRCINDDDFYTHIAQEHLGEGGSHSATPQSIWMFNENYHWHDCKYCDEPSHSKLGVNYHDFNNYDVCKICGFNKKDKILILKQPTSRVCSVSDNEAPIDDPLYYYNNKVKFTVAAKGLSELSYQWYYSYGGNWTECKDESVKDGPTTFVISRGSKTNTFETDVPVDICYDTCYYKCVITDEDGNQVETVPAAVRSRHIYKTTTFVKGDKIVDIYSDKTHYVTAYKSTGHYMECVGDGCEEYKILPHNFEKTKTEVTCYYTKVTWVKTVCKDCGYQRFVREHDHYYEDPENGEYEIDYDYENSLNHKLSCLFDRCDKTTLEPHTFMAWQNVGTPYNTQNGIGSPYKECQLCSYQYTKKPQRYDKAQGKNVSCDWTKENDLVSVKYGSASSDIVYVGDKLIVSFNPSSSDKTDYIKLQYPKCIAWNVYYYCDTGSGVIDKNVSQYFSFTRIKGTANWEVYIPEFADRKGGGTFTFEPIIDKNECTHTSGTRLSGAYEPVCLQDGYTGDTVCVDCGKVTKYGKIIEGGTEHEGELILNPLTVREGSCEQRGYSGTSRCSVCKVTVRGKTTPKVHTGAQNVVGYHPSTCYEFGATGDTYCECGAILKHSKLIEPEHKNVELVGYVAPTSQKDGYSGDTVCQDCDLVLRYGYTLSHDKLVSVITLDGVTSPVAGENPNYSVNVVSTGITIDRFSTPEINRGVDWKNASTNDYVYPHNIFKPSKYYAVTVRVKTGNGALFAGDVTATVNGDAATVYVDPNYPDYATVRYEFPYTRKKNITEIYVTDVKLPIPGTNPDHSFTIEDPYYFETDETFWTDTDTGLGVGYEETFLAGKDYKFMIGLCPTFDEGYGENSKFDENIKVYINSRPAKIETLRDDYIFFGIDMPIYSDVSGTVTSYGSESDPVTIQLTEKGKPEPAYEFVSKGKLLKYEFENVPAGDYTIKVTKKNHETYTKSLTVGHKETIVNVTLKEHICSVKKVAKVAASCKTGKAGKEAYYHCDGCGKNYSDAKATKPIADLSKYGIIKAEHSYGAYEFNYDSTYDKDGTETATCKVCKKTVTRTAKNTKLVNSSKKFNDVKSTAWYKYYVDFAVSYGIFGGKSETTFEPEANIKRAEFVQVLANLSGIDTSNKKVTTKFTDVKSGDWFAPAVKWASDNGIVAGKSATSFDPNALITREEMCVMLVNYANYQKITLAKKVAKAKFTDDSKISSWAKERVYMCQMSELVKGKGEGKFDPKGTAKRCEVATIFTLFYKEYMK
ncbi:MAG: S-layer homology domain-containing protein [Clostridia bacterium]|nr:S-layer homology domain-containing protein [Clostridia bacterium]